MNASFFRFFQCTVILLGLLLIAACSGPGFMVNKQGITQRTDPVTNSLLEEVARYADSVSPVPGKPSSVVYVTSGSNSITFLQQNLNIERSNGSLSVQIIYPNTPVDEWLTAVVLLMLDDGQQRRAIFQRNGDKWVSRVISEVSTQWKLK